MSHQKSENVSIECIFCKRIAKNPNSNRNHERLCKLNPERQVSYLLSEEWVQYKQSVEYKSQNVYTKAKRLGLPKPIIVHSEQARINHATAAARRTPEERELSAIKISNTVREKVKNGTWHTSLAKKMHHNYNGVDLHGKWELNYAKWLDLNNIRWERCKQQFIYNFENKVRYYTPDFYLPDKNEYIEIKGYKTLKDVSKWDQFPIDKKLIVLMQKDLKRLAII